MSALFFSYYYKLALSTFPPVFSSSLYSTNLIQSSNYHTPQYFNILTLASWNQIQVKQNYTKYVSGNRNSIQCWKQSVAGIRAFPITFVTLNGQLY